MKPRLCSGRSTLLRITLLLVLTALGLPASACGDFYYPRVGDDFKVRMARSLFRLYVRGEPAGTGFLVDSQHGLVITAKHVLPTTYRPDEVVTEGINRGNPFIPNSPQSVPFRVWWEHPAKDIVILQAKTPTALAEVRQFEISLAMVGDGFRVTAWGFALGRNVPTTESGEVQWGDSDRLTFNGATLPGYSGSPVFNEFGLVVGVVVDSTNSSHLGVVQPLSQISDVFPSFPAFLEADKLTNEFLRNSMPIANLYVKLKPTDIPPALSNIELLHFVGRLRERSKELPLDAQNMIKCPILYAVIHRGLGEEATRGISQISPASALDLESGRAYLLSGLHWKELGHLPEANSALSFATSALESALHAQIKQNPESLLQLACASGEPESMPKAIEAVKQAFFTPALKHITQESSGATVESERLCADFAGNPFVAGILRDYALASYHLEKLQGKSHGSDETIRYAAAAASLSPSNGNLQATNVALLGDTLLYAGRPKAAAWAYSDAWQNGFKVGWVEKNFTAALAVSRESEDIEFERGAFYKIVPTISWSIEEVPRWESGELFGLAVDQPGQWSMD